MTNTDCKAIFPLLVDYVDDELPDGDSTMVAEHLLICPECRQAVRRLERSLGMVCQSWEAAACSVSRPLALQPACVRTTKRPLVMCALGVVGTLIILVTGLLWRFHSPPSPDSSQDAIGLVAEVRSVQERESARLAEFEEAIQRESQAARLAASAKLLASQTGLEQFSSAAEQYLLDMYGDVQVTGGLEYSTRRKGG